MNLSELKQKPVAELLDIANEMGLEGVARSRKQDVIFSILKAHAKNGESIYGVGVLEILQDGFGFLRSADSSYLAGPDEWDPYFPPMRDRLVATQYPDGHWHGAGVGTTYGTSIALIILQLPHSRLPIMQR